jgi:hypothetical protein
LERLEKRHRRRRPLPAIIMGIYPEEQPGAVLGIDGGGMFVAMTAGETMPELHARAVASIPARILAVRYNPAKASQNHVQPAPAALAPDPAPVPGIGRVATRDELIRMGAIRAPAERFV